MPTYATHAAQAVLERYLMPSDPVSDTDRDADRKHAEEAYGAWQDVNQWIELCRRIVIIFTWLSHGDFSVTNEANSLVFAIVDRIKRPHERVTEDPVGSVHSCLLLERDHA